MTANRYNFDFPGNEEMQRRFQEFLIDLDTMSKSQLRSERSLFAGETKYWGEQVAKGNLENNAKNTYESARAHLRAINAAAENRGIKL